MGRNERASLWLGRILVVLSLFAACLVLHDVVVSRQLPRRIREQIREVATSVRIVTWRDYQTLLKTSREYRKVRSEIEYYREKVLQDPGPPPSLWNVPRYWEWRKQHLLHTNAKTTLETLEQTKRRLEEKTGGLVRHPNKIAFLASLVSPLRLFWNGWVAPVLHFLLALFLFRFALRILVRLLIIKGYFPKAKV